MSYKEMARRLAALEQAQMPPADEGQSYVVDIGGDDAQYWIDGHEVSAHEFTRQVPDGPFSVDIEGDDELP